MRHLLGVLLPFLLQCLLVFITIEMNTGNGSWLGLGALLIGMFAVPGTAIANFLHVKNNREKSTAAVIRRCFLYASIAPFVVLTFFLFA